MALIQNEKFSDTKKRLQARINVSDKELSKYRFTLIHGGTFKQPATIEDGQSSSFSLSRICASELMMGVFTEDIIYDHKFAPEDCLGLDHVDKSGRTRNGTGEKAIVIKG